MARTTSTTRSGESGGRTAGSTRGARAAKGTGTTRAAKGTGTAKTAGTARTAKSARTTKSAGTTRTTRTARSTGTTGRAAAKPRARAASAAGTATATVRRRTAETVGTAASAVTKGVEKAAGSVEKTARDAGRTTRRRTGRAATRRGSGGITLPVVTPRLKIHRVQIPTFGITELGGGLAAAAGRTVAEHLPSRKSLPPKERLGYYAGLGALAAFGVIEWPVAAVIGVGMAVVRGNGSAERAERRPARAAAGEPRTTEAKG